ncbi:unnamed protein product [Durusdinium trenchii]|uniref:Uncharacterized protein n=1 Tax=Durusdinium trenchii TaxID=1381693 RepID=A0ABP0J549_9DINO
MPTHQGPNSAGSPQVWEGKVVCIAMGVAGLIHNYSFELTEEGTSFGGMTGMTADIPKLGNDMRSISHTVTRLKLDGLVVWGAGAAGFDQWDVVRAVLKAYFPIPDMTFTAGTAKGRQFVFEKGQTTMTTPLAMASSSKFPVAIAIAGAVKDGYLTFDTKAHEATRSADLTAVLCFARSASGRNVRFRGVALVEHRPFGASEPGDAATFVAPWHRSERSFTSGFYWPDASGYVPCLGAANASSYSAEECAKDSCSPLSEIYQQAPFAAWTEQKSDREFEPGSTWSYNSFHLQVAGAMAATRAKLSTQQNLKNTSWMGGENPGLAGNMMTTPEDYDSILRAYVGNELLPPWVSFEMERDYLAPDVQVSNASTFLVTLLGHYSFCNYFECFPPKERQVHAGMQEGQHPHGRWAFWVLSLGGSGQGDVHADRHCSGASLPKRLLCSHHRRPARRWDEKGKTWISEEYREAEYPPKYGIANRVYIFWY